MGRSPRGRKIVGHHLATKEQHPKTADSWSFSFWRVRGALELGGCTSFYEVVKDRMAPPVAEKLPTASQRCFFYH